MEEDDSTDAGGNAVVSSEEELAVQPPVFLSVLSINALEALSYTAWKLEYTMYCEPKKLSFQILGNLNFI